VPSVDPREEERSRLVRAEAAYARGDYHALSSLARELANSSTPEVAARAQALLRSVRPDRWHVAVLVLCALAFTVICWHYLRP
jgi:hypothetical protein